MVVGTQDCFWFFFVYISLCSFEAVQLYFYLCLYICFCIYQFFVVVVCVSMLALRCIYSSLCKCECTELCMCVFVYLTVWKMFFSVSFVCEHFYMCDFIFLCLWFYALICILLFVFVFIPSYIWCVYTSLYLDVYFTFSRFPLPTSVFIIFNFYFALRLSV